MANQEPTSNLLIPFMSQIKVAKEKARRSIKRRIEYYRNKETQNENDAVGPEIAQLFDLEPETAQPSDLTDGQIEEIKPNVGEYWSLKKGQDLFVIIDSVTPLFVKYFQPSVPGGKNHILNNDSFPFLLEDLDKKIDAPKVVYTSKSRQYYDFE